MRRAAFTVAATISLMMVLTPGSAQADDWNAIWTQGGFEEEVGTHVAIDDQLNVYVAGFIVAAGRSDYDMLALKYNSAGVKQWEYQYDSGFTGAAGFDKPCGIAVDDAGNVYMAGRGRYERSGSQDYDYITIKLDGNGVHQWTRNYDYLDGSDPHGDDIPAGMAVDGAGNVYVTGDSDNAYLTVKYNTTGVEQWTKRFDGDFTGTVGPATAIAIDDNGNAFVTGYSMDENAYYDYVTIGYTSAGAQMWKTRYGQTSIHEFKAWDIAVDNAGTVAVTGHAAFTGVSNLYDVLTVAYNSGNGVEKWHKSWTGTGDDSVYDDYGNAVAFGPDGSVYVAGGATMAGNETDFVTIKYTPGGTEVWARTYNQLDSASGFSHDYATDIGVDSAGRVFVAGPLWMDNGGMWRESNYAMVVYTSGGDIHGLETWDPVDYVPTDDRAFALALTAGGDAAVTGAAYGATTFDDIGTTFYLSDLIFADGFEIGNTSRWTSTVN